VKTRPTAPFDVETFLATSSPGHTISKYGRGDAIFAQGDPADDIFYVQHGQVKITVISHRGKEAVVAILLVGQFFGETALNGERMRLSTAMAIEDSTIVRITRSVMLDTLHKYPAFSQFFIHHLLSRNLRIEKRGSRNCAGTHPGLNECTPRRPRRSSLRPCFCSAPCCSMR
jgi:CRP-like cAMP-binding protein